MLFLPKHAPKKWQFIFIYDNYINFIYSWGNFDRPIKVTPRVNKVNIIIVNKNKLPFLWRVFWKEKHVGECVNKKQSIFMFISLILVTLSATLG